jgi:hypothetical protein
MQISSFNPADYGPTVADLLATPRLASLGPGSPDETMRPKLQALKLAPICMSGLWLYFDFLDESHNISQGIETPEGSFWHAIMHRREPDADNSKYWWRRVGKHPVIDALREQAPRLGYDYSTPQAFVNFCESVRDTGSPDEMLARRVQAREWQLLFDWCYRQGGGTGRR